MLFFASWLYFVYHTYAHTHIHIGAHTHTRIDKIHWLSLDISSACVSTTLPHFIQQQNRQLFVRWISLKSTKIHEIFCLHTVRCYISADCKLTWEKKYSVLLKIQNLKRRKKRWWCLTGRKHQRKDTSRQSITNDFFSAIIEMETENFTIPVQSQQLVLRFFPISNVKLTLDFYSNASTFVHDRKTKSESCRF